MTGDAAADIGVTRFEGALPDDVNDSVSLLIAAARAADGADPISEQGLRSLEGKVPGEHVVATSGGVPAGVATIRSENGTPNVELVVDPARRRQGIGRALINEAAARGAQVWAHGDLAAAAALAASAGMTRTRELLQMRRGLGPDATLPEVDQRNGVVVRTYSGPNDDAEIVRVNNAAFHWHPEQGGWTQADIDSRKELAWFDPEGLFLAFSAEAPSTLLGFHWTKTHPADPPEPALGEVYIVGVDPAAHGRGLGKLLTLQGLHYLRDRSLDAVLLYVEADNTAALRTYEKLGFSRYFTDVVYIMA
ncbi:mycothiol synthase [Hoyosella subflava]|uniref:Mycothiol acetyltransferase n=1 Tax=Hoyosella subflava (strain DSM 45089 / JCM 17490 / NBRC 109087 / DQS3-9A1) TaxID=443218 RepID=F6ELB0_HOYSD|nr:mycothiol synthase [Hoyosella subflava]AEF39202.1 Mycothiol acetyltransferase [Hoyosella subflava DQS3-9A1]